MKPTARSAGPARPWYRFENVASDPTVAEIHIIDFIGDWLDELWGFGVTAKAFVDELAKLPATVNTIRVHINSPGGDIQGGVNIANALREQVSKGRRVETIVDGLAASIASVIAMAGETVTMADNALMMIHNPWTIEIGSASDLRKTADVLDTMRGQIVATYQWHSELTDADLIALMDAETWMDADEAIAHGLATDKIEGLKAAASIDPRALATLKIPAQYRDRVAPFIAQSDEEDDVPVAEAADVLARCQAAGCLDLASALVAEHATLAEVEARIATTQAARAAATERATAISTACAQARVPELAAGYIAGAMTLPQVKAHLVTITAKLDAAEIDAGLHPDAGTMPKRRAVANPNAMFAESTRH